MASDALSSKVLGELEEWIAWLSRNNARGLVGEFGWPYDHDVDAWNRLAGAYLDRIEEGDPGRSLAYGVLGTDNALAADATRNLRAPAAIGATHAHVLAFWDKLQPTPWGPLDPVTVDNLVARIAEAKRLGMAIVLEPAIQYPPEWALSTLARFRQQTGATWSGDAPGLQVRDWVWDAIAWDAVEDFLRRLGEAIPLSEIERLRIGGGYNNEAHFPPTSLTAPQWWGFGDAAQGRAALAPLMSPCPHPEHIPYGRTNPSWTPDWVRWYVESIGLLQRRLILLWREIGFTGPIHVLTPGYQMRDNYTVSSAAYQEAASAGEDLARQLPHWRDLPDVFPWCTWADKDHFAGNPLPTVDSDKAPWLRIRELATMSGVDSDLWCENTAGVSPGIFGQVFGPRGPITGGYHGVMWLDHEQLRAGNRIGYSRLQNAATSHDRRLWATAWAAGRAWGNLKGPGLHYELAQVTNLVNDQGLATTLPNAGPIVERASSHDARIGYNLSAFEYGALGVDGYSGSYQPFVITHTDADFAFLTGRNVRLVRMPMAWERLQPTLGAALNTTALAQLRRMVESARASGIGVILDLHNYARYGRGPRGSVTVSVLATSTGSLRQEHLVDFWCRISEVFRDDPTIVGYGLMNEPHTMAAETSGGESLDLVRRYGFTRTTEGWRSQTAGTSSVWSRTENGGGGVGALITRRASLRRDGANELMHYVTKPLAGGAFRGRQLRARVKWVSSGTVARPVRPWMARLDYRAADARTWVQGSWTSLAGKGVWTNVVSTFTTDIPAEKTGLRTVIRSENVGAMSESTFAIDDVQELRIRGTGRPSTVAPSVVWERISQAVVSALRSVKGDTKLILISGYHYSKVQEWQEWHVSGSWITDPANNFRYEGHHYWDSNEDSVYGPDAFASALAQAETI